MAKTMHTKLSNWTLDERVDKWYGICIECKGEKAKYTPETLKDKSIKPCSVCTDMETYTKHSANKEKR